MTSGTEPVEPFAAAPLVYLVQPAGGEGRVLSRSDLDAGHTPGQDETRPVVFLPQPQRYRVVPPERLREWETVMSQAVGLPPPRKNSDGNAQLRNPTLSFASVDDAAWPEDGCDADLI
jgi:hypothetical protein